MKFKIDKSAIINEFQSLAAVADKKQTLPILSNILIRCEADSVRLLSTDLEVELSVSLDGANIELPGETTIPAKKAADIIRELPDGQVSFELNEESSKLTVRSSSGKYNLSTIPGSDFPDFDVVKSDTTYKISSHKLFELFQKTSFAMANQDWRHYLNGCLFEKNEKSLDMVATDAHRLSIYKSNLEGEGNFNGIIPRKTVVELMKILSKNDEDIGFYINTNNIVFMSKKFTFKSKLIDGNYPNYNQVVPKGEGSKITFNRKNMLDSLSRVSVLTSEKFKGVKLKANSGVLDISAHNPDQESAEEKLDITGPSNGFDIAFNVNYLKEVLSTIDEEEISLISFGSDKSALVESGDPNQVLVLMPLLL
ncbi:MAG: DNA polymerase III subunit beta [Gammaproteobacteria bacterium TMED112]|nr:MAG: DNA polymerase III subunit beta [Gammaproteobacteria bacterium TMED112]|tara:strand:- start:31740 stop:32837 length:1098 start_codon:yes stop_codon:yes gene_type:complete